LADHDENVLSCGHTSKFYKVAKSENVPVADNMRHNIIQDPELANSKEIKIEPKNMDESIPVTFSGDAGVKKEGFLVPNISLIRQGDTIIVNGPINAYNINISTTETITTTNIDISSIIEKVSSSSNTPVEKEKVRDLLNQLSAEISSRPIPSILENLKTKFKEYFPIASPYIQMVTSAYIQNL
jgi:hypothetical protein